MAKGRHEADDLVEGRVDVEPGEAVGLVLLEPVAPVDKVVALREGDVLAVALGVHLAVVDQVPTWTHRG